jgi:hypothetical protein
MKASKDGYRGLPQSNPAPSFAQLDALPALQMWVASAQRVGCSETLHSANDGRTNTHNSTWDLIEFRKYHG